MKSTKKLATKLIVIQFSLFFSVTTFANEIQQKPTEKKQPEVSAKAPAIQALPAPPASAPPPPPNTAVAPPPAKTAQPVSPAEPARAVSGVQTAPAAGAIQPPPAMQAAPETPVSSEAPVAAANIVLQNFKREVQNVGGGLPDDFELITITPYFKNKSRIAHLNIELLSNQNVVLASAQGELGDCKDCIRGASIKGKLGVRIYGEALHNLRISRKNSTSIKLTNCLSELNNNQYTCEFQHKNEDMKLVLKIEP